MRNTLTVSGLSKQYGRKTVLKKIDLSVSTSEIVGLLGPNGAGKTTTFYSILGMVKPDSGSIMLDDTDISALPMYRRALAGISYLPQEPSIFKKLTVEDNIRAVLEIKGLGRAEIESRTSKLLREFGLAEFSRREGFKLSGGERRRTEIARALATEPTFMLFDEPFAGIDPLAIVELKKMMTYLRDKGLGIIITDHNVRDTLSITDRAYIISGGEILDHGTPEKLVADEKVKKVYLGEEFSL
ncbi:MAG: LPS export ABC transporter ATP-binding protein [Thermodesulfovibrionales bacterium]